MPQQFTPDLINNLAFWFEPSRTGGAFKDVAKTTPATTDGDAIAVLADLSGNGYDAAQATTANQPIYKTAGGFALPCARFNGTSSLLSLGQPPGLDLLQYGGLTLCFALNMTGGLPSSNNNALLGKFGSGTETRIGFGIDQAGHAFRYSQVTTLGGGPSAFVANQKSIYTYRMRLLNEAVVNGANGVLQLAQEEFFVNGRRALAQVNSVAAWDTIHNWLLGSLISGGFNWGGDLALAACYGRDLTDAELSQIHGYASTRFGGLNKPFLGQSGNKMPLRAHVSCVGTSLTQGVPNYAASYPLQMESLLPYARVYNFGLGSQKSPAFVANAANREDQFVDPSLANIAVYEGGTNDMAFATGAAASAYANAQTWAAARRAAGYKYVLGCTVLPRNGGTGNFAGGQTPGGFEADRQTYNAAMRADGTTWDYVVDVGATTNITVGGQVYNTSALGAPGACTNAIYFQASDQTHLTPAGYAILAGAVAAAVGLVNVSPSSSVLSAADNASIAAAVRVAVRPGGSL